MSVVRHEKSEGPAWLWQGFGTRGVETLPRVSLEQPVTPQQDPSKAPCCSKVLTAGRGHSQKSCQLRFTPEGA